ncbi:iron-sulfur cluster assembly protein SufB [Klebsiella pneumoniae]|uniref:Iron-sulfur cluster assembly protein SufB n=1 Tax=Klebsiella pneumoniae TaxID=573 RepID=A0A2X3C6A7_KLEPN|nr:iron-sulfur cluster assembly protein SufB [Klebsiella pneumoniae]
MTTSCRAERPRWLRTAPFIYVPKGVRCPMELSTYFRINAEKTGQFERTILVADEGSYVSYIEGCSAPVRDSYQLHAAVVEVIIHKDAEVKYSTVQNWFPGDNNTGGILNFVTKRALCEGENSKMSWTQSETGSAITWKYPSCILRGDNSIGEFFSVALTSGHQQADTGTKMIHIGKNTRSTIISKGISAGHQSEQLSRAGQNHADRHQRPQLYPVRFDADRPGLRGAYLPVC